MTDSIGIPGHPGHDIPDPGMVEEVEVQLLQFPVHILAQHKKCVLTDPLEQHLVAVADGRPEECDADHQCQNRHQQIILPAIDDFVDQFPRQERIDDDQEGIQENK